MYICCGKYSLLLVFVFAPRGFSPVLGYSTLLKSQHFEIQIRPGNRQTKNHLLNELPLNIYLFIYLHGSDNLEKVMNFTSRLEKSLNSVQVLEQYLTSLLGLEKSLKFTTLSTPGFFFSVKLDYFTDANFGASLVQEPVKLTGSAKAFLCMNNILFLFFILNSICTSNAIASHTQSFCKVLLRIVV